MSGASWTREFGSLALSMLGSLLGWVLLAPLALLIPKRRDWIAVIGRQNGKFLDNCKYFYLQSRSQSPDLRVVFITERADTIAFFTGRPEQVLRYPSIKSAWYLLRSGSTVVDSTDWGRNLRRFLLLRSRLVQLWHGVGFKRIELDKWRNETGRYRWFSKPWVFSLRMLFYRVTGRVVRYDIVANTSRFYRDEVFAPAFLGRHFPITGYPRNAFARMSDHDHVLAWANADLAVASRLQEWATAGRKLIVVTPTTRDSGAAPMQIDAETVRVIDAFSKAHGLEFVFKFHPSERAAGFITGSHLHTCSSDSDIYPLLAHADALVTDYSSIYMDYLLLDRPVLFLIPDGDSYMRNDRQVQFDLAEMMPGPIAASWQELLTLLNQQWTEDAHAEERRTLCNRSFDGLSQNDATTRLIEFMRKQYWLPEASNESR